MNAGRLALQAHIALGRVGAVPAVIAITLMLGGAAWVWFAVMALDQGQQEHTLAQARQELQAPSAASVVLPEFGAEQNLRKYYDVLGDRSETERYLKTLFAIAAQTGISLDQGEYQGQLDKDSDTYRYQIFLPVNGSYGDIRRFCEQMLLALPFASLDELNFKRESASADALDASLRFTLYLKAEPRTTQQPGIMK